jgi:hypothetical protein
MVSGETLMTHRRVQGKVYYVTVVWIREQTTRFEGKAKSWVISSLDCDVVWRCFW